MKELFLSLEDAIWDNSNSWKKQEERSGLTLTGLSDLHTLNHRRVEAKSTSSNWTEDQQFIAQTPFSIAQPTGTHWGNSILTKYLAIRSEVHMVELTLF